MTGRYGEVSAGWKRLFVVAALFNALVGLAGMLVPEATVDGRIIGLLIFAFGVIYFQVSTDPLRYGPVLWAGVLGKLGVVALLAPGEFGEGGNWVIQAVLTADALLAIAFLAFLFRTGDSGRE
ncbi:hypothetical protein [Altererythrobacter sp.]|uniref:hypothetical protein n=1 Tax=Altererythrobacter sp. TaxID=1872480 RepID=UPI003CFEF83C